MKMTLGIMPMTMGMEREITGIGWMDKVITWVFSQPGWLSALILTAVVVLIAAMVGTFIGKFYMSVRYPDPEKNPYLSPVQKIVVLVAGVAIVGILMTSFLANDDEDALLVDGDGFDPGYGDTGDGFMDFDPNLYDAFGNYIGPDLYDDEGNLIVGDMDGEGDLGDGTWMGDDDFTGDADDDAIDGGDEEQSATPVANGGTSGGGTVRSSGGTVRSSGGGTVVYGGGGGTVVVERVG